MMIAPNVTAGEWTLCRRLYGKEQEVIGFHIAAPKEGSRAPVCQSGLISLPEIEANGVMLAASKKLAEALNELLRQHQNIRAAEGYPIEASLAMSAAREALLSAGYTDSAPTTKE
jgi:hypothetical protein